MIIRAAYLGVVLIWSTTPLAIQLSSQGSHYLFALSTRMLIGLSVLSAIFTFTRLKLSYSPSALRVYVISGLGINVSMMCVYWGAQFIPSGWIAVIFGLSPITTGLLSAIFISGNNFSAFRVLGIACGLIGLLIIFGTGSQLNLHALWGIAAVFTSAFAHSLSAVLIKQVNSPISGMEASFGGLSVAAPILLLVFLISGEPLMIEAPISAWVSILYLGVVATALGFTLYYYILKNLDAIRVSMITLITPVIALIIGNVINHEPLSASILFGAVLVSAGLAMFEFEKYFTHWLKRILKHRLMIKTEDLSS